MSNSLVIQSQKWRLPEFEGRPIVGCMSCNFECFFCPMRSKHFSVKLRVCLETTYLAKIIKKKKKKKKIAESVKKKLKVS